MTRAANEAYERLIYAQQNRPSPEEWAKIQAEQQAEKRKDQVRKMRKGIA